MLKWDADVDAEMHKRGFSLPPLFYGHAGEGKMHSAAWEDIEFSNLARGCVANLVCGIHRQCSPKEHKPETHNSLAAMELHAHLDSPRPCEV